MICNSGNANTCNANGIEIASETCEILAKKLGINADDVIVASTGVIGQAMTIDPFKTGIPALADALGYNNLDVCEAIMTTDTRAKSCSVEFTLGGKTCKLGGIAKGSGMIHPNMATMLVFITTDAAISSEMLSKALSSDVQNSFNMISIDGDTSTNDMVTVMANGLAGNDAVITDGNDFSTFMCALNTVTVALCRMIAADGEGATKLLECVVTGSESVASAKAIAKSVICSSLTKAAMFGADANWGRVLCAIGYAGVPADVSKVGVSFKSAAGAITVCENGAGVDFSEELAKTVLSESEIDILVTLGDGDSAATAWGCDLTYDYVKINGDYRT